MFVSFHSFDFCMSWFVICAPWCSTRGAGPMIRVYYWVCCSLRAPANTHPNTANTHPTHLEMLQFDITHLLSLWLWFCINFILAFLFAFVFASGTTHPGYDLTAAKFIINTFSFLDGDWMYVGRTAGWRRARRKLSDENANSFLVKEEKAWCRIFAPGGRETAAYGLVQSLWRHVNPGTEAPVACNVTRKTTPS